MRIAVLMATFNGKDYIEEQINSILNQSGVTVDIYVSDDGSSDGSIKILKKLYDEKKIYSLISGPGLGYAKNFLSLAKKVKGTYRYYCFSDQDDIWHSSKLLQGTLKLNAVPDELPSLFCSRTRYVDVRGNCLGLSPLMRIEPAFANSIAQSIAGGNTMVFNRALLQQFVRIPDHAKLISHDWMICQICLGLGGFVFYSSQPLIDYRQHGNNVVGQNRGLGNYLSRFGAFLDGRYRYWINCNVNILNCFQHQFTDENKNIYNKFLSFRSSSFSNRMRIGGVPLYRQDFLSSQVVKIGAWFNKV